MRSSIIRIGLVFLSSLMLMGIFGLSYLRRDFKTDIMENLVFEGEVNGESIELSMWKDETDGKYYLFVPSWFYGEKGSFILHYPQGSGCVLIDGTRYESGEIWVDEGDERAHEIEIRAAFEEDKEGLKFSMQVLASQNLPSVFVAIEEKDGVISDVEFDNKQYLEAGYLEIRDVNGSLLCQQELDRFKVRGNLTATQEKKPFTFSTKEAVGILGMEPAIKWNLLSNSSDGTYIRNKIISDLAYECIDAYEPQGEHVELYVNGEYQGLYLLMEAVEFAENRMELGEDDYWLLEMELAERVALEPFSVTTQEGHNFVIHSEMGITEREFEEIERCLNDVESALYAPDGVSRISGKALNELMDLESFAEAWLVQELSGDHDTGITSQFMYANKKDGIWYAGPVWDFDGIMGNVNTPLYAVPEALTTSIEITRPEGNQNKNRWLAAMWKHEAFQEIVKEKYERVFRNEYERIRVEEIDRYTEQIYRATVLDSFRWHKSRLGWWFTRPKEYSDPILGDYTRFDTVEMFTDDVKEFMKRKIQFLDKIWIEDKEFCIVEIRNPAEFLEQWNNQTLYYWVEKGTAIENLPCYEAPDYSFDGYYKVTDGTLVMNGTVIEEDCVIEGKWVKGAAE